MPRLPGYLDGELEESRRVALETHLARCGACAAALDELRAIVDAAAGLEDRAPETDLWTGIEERITRPAGLPDGGRSAAARPVRPASAARRRVSFTLPQLAAAAVALVLLSAAGARLVLPPAGTPMDGAVPGPGWVAVPSGGPADSEVRFAATGAFPREAEREYGSAIDALRQALERRRDRLDSTTVRVLETNLRAIDAAIRDAYAALAQDPSDPYLRHHLTRIRTRKLELLRRAVDAAGSEL